jgi:hypothetical protein
VKVNPNGGALALAIPSAAPAPASSSRSSMRCKSAPTSRRALRPSASAAAWASPPSGKRCNRALKHIHDACRGRKTRGTLFVVIRCLNAYSNPVVKPIPRLLLLSRDEICYFFLISLHIQNYSILPSIDASAAFISWLYKSTYFFLPPRFFNCFSAALLNTQIAFAKNQAYRSNTLFVLCQRP